MPQQTDVSGDGLPDVVGFANAGVAVGVNTGTGFKTAELWSSNFGNGDAAGGWRVESHPRTLVDVSGDGLPDVVGFANAGVAVGVNTGTGFKTAELWSSNFGNGDAAGGWRVESHPRTLVDVSGDGLPDVVGFANDGVAVGVNTGTGFNPSSAVGGHAEGR